MTAKPEISVVMATFNRAAIIGTTIEHLIEQDFAPDAFELIVVDDGSSDDTEKVVMAAAPRARFEIVYLSHPNRGPSHTQNRGIRTARAPLVLLMADDIWLTPHCLRVHVQMHQDNPAPVTAVLGKVVKSPKLCQTAFMRNWEAFPLEKYDGLTEIPYYLFGAFNLSFKKDFMLRHGMFRENMGRAGPRALEDIELGYRLHQRGLRLLFSGERLGYHYHPATLQQTIDVQYERGLNFGQLEGYAPDPELIIFYHLLKWKSMGQYRRILRGSNNLVGMDRRLYWHIVRYVIKMLIFNALTAPWIWRPILDYVEKKPWSQGLVNPKIYRAFLHYYFVKGIRDGRRLYGG